MSLILDESHGIIAKTGFGPKVNLYRPKNASDKAHPPFDIEIDMGDFMCLMEYVLENTELQGKEDPRLGFVEYVKTLVVRNKHLQMAKKKAAKK